MIFVPHGKHMSPYSLMGIALLLYVEDVRTSRETRVSISSYGDSFAFICRWCSYLTGNIDGGFHGLLGGYRYVTFTFIEIAQPAFRGRNLRTLPTLAIYQIAVTGLARPLLVPQAMGPVIKSRSTRNILPSCVILRFFVPAPKVICHNFTPSSSEC
jgi:hypothetical protein